ncbi:hypothetical protein HAX54_047210 [Datura stramonium]|uniref:Uncharacterized protein n=1 Tax=Datura stramonium TaxID=4076 RepID=A0ABS8STY5_DATST|nr:hypothetical protein [Datura stramonium]
MESGQGWNFLQRGTEAIAELKLRATEPSRSLTVLRLPIFHNFLPSPMCKVVLRKSSSKSICVEFVEHRSQLAKAGAKHVQVTLLLTLSGGICGKQMPTCCSRCKAYPRLIALSSNPPSYLF